MPGCLAPIGIVMMVIGNKEMSALSYTFPKTLGFQEEIGIAMMVSASKVTSALSSAYQLMRLRKALSGSVTKVIKNKVKQQ